MLGIDTGEGGLVEKSVAVPTAITKGVVGGIGQMLGVKKKPKETAPEEEAAPQAGGAAPSEAAAETPQPAAAQPAQQPAAQAAPKQQAAPQEKKSAPGQVLDGIFGN
jgi:hypothetical protein